MRPCVPALPFDENENENGERGVFYAMHCMPEFGTGARVKIESSQAEKHNIALGPDQGRRH